VTGEPNEADARPKDDLPEMRYNHFTRRVEPVIDADGDNED
jgi:hypothetical protein